MPAQIHYFTLQDETPRKEKLDWFRNNKLSDLEMERIHPDEKGNWLNITDNDFEDLLPLASKEVKGNKAGVGFDKAVFKLFSLGVKTNRDEWVHDFSEATLVQKIAFFYDYYEKEVMRWQESDKNQLTNDFVDRTIKWTAELENHMIKKSKLIFNPERIRKTLYRPYSKEFLYLDKIIIHRIYLFNEFLGIENIFKNKIISFSGIGSSKSFQCLASNGIIEHDTLEITQCLPFYRYDETGNRIENITDWGLEQFRRHYQTCEVLKTSQVLGKEAIFHYVYAVLHNPAYRKKYEQNLKRDFPRIPFYDDFEQWAAWGKALMDLHISYENAALFPLNRVERAIPQGASSDQRQLFARVEEVAPLYKTEVKIKPKLKADKETGTIEIDEQTTLTGIPTEAWAYKLGNRSALEWILDQYKESKPTDPTILEKFNHYRFADYKEEVIVLLQKVCTVSVETMKIIRAMEAVG